MCPMGVQCVWRSEARTRSSAVDRTVVWQCIVCINARVAGHMFEWATQITELRMNYWPVGLESAGPGRTLRLYLSFGRAALHSCIPERAHNSINIELQGQFGASSICVFARLCNCMHMHRPHRLLARIARLCPIEFPISTATSIFKLPLFFIPFLFFLISSRASAACVSKNAIKSRTQFCSGPKAPGSNGSGGKV